MQELYEEALLVLGDQTGSLGKRIPDLDHAEIPEPEDKDQDQECEVEDELDEIEDDIESPKKKHVRSSGSPKQKKKTNMDVLQRGCFDVMDEEIFEAKSGQKNRYPRTEEIENELDVSPKPNQAKRGSPTQSELLDDELGDIIPSAKNSNPGTPIIDNNIAVGSPNTMSQGRIKIDFV